MNRALSSRDVRISNGKVVLHHLFHNPPMTRQDIADATGLSLPTVTNILKNLREKGLVSNGEKLLSDGGRPAVHVLPVYDAACSVGIHVKHDQIRLAMADLAMNLLASRTVRMPFDHATSYWSEVASVLEAFLAEHASEGRRLLGVGIALQSPQEPDSDAMRFYAGGKTWSIRPEEVVPCFGGRDIHFVGEAKMESYVQSWGRKLLRDFVYLSVDDHIGGAIVLEAKVFDYERPNAEFGHLPLARDGRTCSCGQRGCLDAICSVTALEDATGFELPLFFDRLAAGDTGCQAFWKEWMDAMSRAILNIRLTLCLDILIGGDMAMHLNPHLQTLREHVAHISPFESHANYLHLADCGEYSAAIGAGLMLNDHFLSSMM